MKKIGIYKITSPTKKVYIGQSIDIEERFRRYYLIQNCSNQVKLYRSFKKHGSYSHKFEIIEECSVDQLNERERHWQEYYDVIGKNGLNCKLTTTNEKSGLYSEETKKVLSIRKQGVFDGQNNPMYGRTHSEETKNKIRLKAIGRKHSDESKKKISESGKARGYKMPIELIDKLRKIKKGVKLTDDHKLKISKTRIQKKIEAPNKIIVFDSQTGIYYESIKEASIFTNVTKAIIQYQIHRENKRFKK